MQIFRLLEEKKSPNGAEIKRQRITKIITVHSEWDINLLTGGKVSGIVHSGQKWWIDRQTNRPTLQPHSKKRK